jgi:hypothetical protein
LIVDISQLFKKKREYNIRKITLRDILIVKLSGNKREVERERKCSFNLLMNTEEKKRIYFDNS